MKSAYLWISHKNAVRKMFSNEIQGRFAAIPGYTCTIRKNYAGKLDKLLYTLVQERLTFGYSATAHIAEEGDRDDSTRLISESKSKHKYFIMFRNEVVHIS